MSHNPTTDQIGAPDEVEIRVVNLGDAPVPDVDADPPAGPDQSAPAAAQEPVGGVQILTPERVARTIQLGSARLAESRGRPYWAYSAEEAEMVAEPLAGELNDLFRALPGVGRAADALGGRRTQLAAALAITAGPRLVMDALTPSQHQQAAAAADLARREQRRGDALTSTDGGGRPTPTRPPAGEPDSLASILADTPPPGA